MGDENKEGADDKSGSKGGTGGDDGNKALAAQLAASQKAAADAQAKLDKYEKDQKDAKDKDRLTKGEHEKLIAELKAQNESTAAALKAFESASKARAEKLLAKLPDAVKEKVTKYREKLSLADWVSMIEDEVEIGGSAGPGHEPPPGGTPNSGGDKGKPGVRELQPKSIEILEMLAVDPTRARKLKADQMPGTNDFKFSDTIMGFLRSLKERGRVRPAARNTEGR